MDGGGTAKILESQVAVFLNKELMSVNTSIEEHYGEDQDKRAASAQEEKTAEVQGRDERRGLFQGGGDVDEGGGGGGGDRQTIETNVVDGDGTGGGGESFVEHTGETEVKPPSEQQRPIKRCCACIGECNGCIGTCGTDQEKGPPCWVRRMRRNVEVSFLSNNIKYLTRLKQSSSLYHLVES